jgi:hypothetical protein
MAWECNAGQFCECSHILGHPRAGEQPQPFLKSLFRFGWNKIVSSQDLMAVAWTSIAIEYSYRKLTKHTDKLVAMSGLAQAIMKFGCVGYDIPRRHLAEPAS